MPRVTDIRSTDGKLIRNLVTSEDPLKAYKTGEVLFGTVKSADGQYDNWYRLFLPTDFDPSKKYPVVLYVYGGPIPKWSRILGSVRCECGRCSWHRKAT